MIPAANLLLHAATKLIGNALSPAHRLYHRLYPSKRFQLPEHMPAAFDGRALAIEKNVWQRNYTGRVTSDFAINFHVNRLFSRDFNHHFMTDQQADKFINDNFPGRISDAYNSLKNGAARADIWRLLVLHKYGGIYLDIDATFSAPPSWFLGHDEQEVLITDRSGKITNYFLASRAGNEKLMALVEKIVTNIEERAFDRVFELTGPAVIRELSDTLAFKPRLFRGIASHGQMTLKQHQYIDQPKGHWSQAKTVDDIVDVNFVPQKPGAVY
ncbi:MAG: glycosyltransferase [Pseudomonadota bacterium]